VNELAFRTGDLAADAPVATVAPLIEIKDIHKTADSPLIEIKNICKTFVTSGDVHVDALKDVSLTIYPGEFVAIMGASGSGKSTLMNILGCLDRPTSGTYSFVGYDVSELDSDALAWLRREAFGFVFQHYNLLPNATAEENVEIPAVYAGLGAAERRTRADALLSILGLGDRLTHRPSQLSGGQQQRVSIARAMMNGGKVILADEPTGALDSKSGAEVMTLLKDLTGEGHTVILITHDANVAAHANRVIELKDGGVIRDSGVGRAPDLAIQLPIDLSGLDHTAASSAHFAGLGESLQMALRALRANVLRTMLTLLGIVIGVGSVVAMLAIGEGSKQQVIAQIGQMGTNLLSVRPQFRNARGYNGSIATLTPEDAKAIGELADVKLSMPDIQGGNTVRYSDIDYQTTITATTEVLSETRSWPVARGVFFNADDEISYATVVVLGQTVVDALFTDGSDPIGKYILIKNVPFQVIGVMSQKGAMANGNDTDDVVFVPLTTGMLRIFGQRFVRTITVAVDDLANMGAVQDSVTNLLKERHNGANDFQIRNMADVLETATVAQNTMTVLLGSVAAISLLVGGIGIMNIMLVSVTERTHEIGIRMATGARERDILQQFLSEAVVVSGIGGFVGVAGGIGAGYIIQAFGNPIAFTVPPMVLAFCCAAATGLIFGYAPARKAAKLDPVVALGSE
jgi:macrolide transport system ATP-binding/permease protein